MLSRELIIKVLNHSLSEVECVSAAWLAGSDAFDRVDR